MAHIRIKKYELFRYVLLSAEKIDPYKETNYSSYADMRGYQYTTAYIIARNNLRIHAERPPYQVGAFGTFYFDRKVKKGQYLNLTVNYFNNEGGAYSTGGHDSRCDLYVVNEVKNQATILQVIAEGQTASAGINKVGTYKFKITVDGYLAFQLYATSRYQTSKSYVDIGFSNIYLSEK